MRSNLLIAALLLALHPGARGEEVSRAQRVEDAFNGLSADTVEALGDFYAEEVRFEDPLVQINGLERLKTYYADLYTGIEEIRFEFREHVEQGALHTATWTMYIKTPKMNGGEEMRVEGASLLKFDTAGKVIYHRDYFDLGEMVYQHVPVVRYLVRKVNERLTKDLPDEDVRRPQK